MDDKDKIMEALEQLQNLGKVGEDDGKIEDDNKVEEEEGNEAEENGDENRLVVFESSNSPPVIPTESEVIKLETLALPSQSDPPSGTSSHLVSEVQVDCTLQSHESTEEHECQIKVDQQQPLTIVATPNDEAHLLDRKLSNCQTSSLELSPTSVTQSTLSIASPNLKEQRVSPLRNSHIVVAETKQKQLFDSGTASISPSVKASSVDGYNWRKYGQKQVKSPHGSRSYYRCTYCECHAKKIECCDNISSVTEVIYKSSHNHDPPQKINFTRERKLALLVAAPVVGSDSTKPPVRTISNEDPAKPSEEKAQEKLIPDNKQCILSGSDGNCQMNVMGELIDERKSKVRVKKNSTLYPDPVSKPGKRPKLVVHADGDVGISGDGYRWRKYGQKIVKGTPHPRNYYRCTSAGCPVRKHIEMANDSKNQLVITYKGVHDHDMPVPKKRHRLPGAPLVAAAAPVSISDTQWSVGKAGELTGEPLDIEGKNAIEPTPTLLSIDFEDKPC